MPQPILSASLDPARLLERAVQGLFPLPSARPGIPWPTLPAWVVLRQGGLRDDLHRLAAERGVAGWFGPSVCLFSEVTERWSNGASPAPLTDPERQTLVGTLIRRLGGSLFGQTDEAWVPAVDRLIGELMSEGITAEAFSQALDSSAHGDFASRRAEVLAAIYAGWIEALHTAGRVDGRDGLIRLANEIEADAEAFAARLGGRRDVRFVGLSDLRGGWRRLLQAMVASPALDRLEIITSYPLTLPASLGAQLSSDEGDGSFANALFSNAEFTGPAVLLLEAPDSAREVEEVAVRVRRLVDEGVPPARIAVIARQARPLVNEMAAALGRLGVPVTARRRTALAHTGPARAIRTILTGAAESWSRHSLTELAENPLLATGLDPAVVSFVGYSRAIGSRDGWTQGFQEVLARYEARERGEDEDEHPKPLPPKASVQQTIGAWRNLHDLLAPLDTPRSLRGWFLWVAGAVRNEKWGLSAAVQRPLSDAAARRDDVKAADLIAEYAGAWAAALDQFGGDSGMMDAATFHRRFELLLDQDLINRPHTDFGVAVGEALAAGWRSFDYVFLLGLSAGQFPLRSRAGGIFDEEERRALISAGLPLDAPDGWRERERELFRVLCAAPRKQLTLSWPTMDASGREVTRSAFVDEAAAALLRSLGKQGADVDEDSALAEAGLLDRMRTNEMLVPGFPVATTREALERARTAAQREQARATEPTPWNGLIEDSELRQWLAGHYGEDFVWSATQLEQAAKCPWHWFAQRLLRLDPKADPDDAMEPTVRGSIMHDALDRFFRAARERMAGPAFLRESDRAWAGPLMEQSVSSAWAAAAESGEWLGPESLQNVARNELVAELQEYLAFEIDWNDKSFNARTAAAKQVRMGAEEGEFCFDDVRLSGAGVNFKLRGSVDRVDRGVDERIEDAARYIAAIDYKSTISSTPAAGKPTGWADGVVLQVPLYAAALRAERPGDQVARMEYRTIRKPKLVHSLSFAPLKGGVLQSADEAEEKLASALDAAGRRIEAVRSGKLPAAPAPSCGCSPYCPARDVCRIPGGPVEA